MAAHPRPGSPSGGLRDRDLATRVAPEHQAPDFADDVAARLDDARTLAAVRLALRALRPAEREEQDG